MLTDAGHRRRRRDESVREELRALFRRLEEGAIPEVREEVRELVEPHIQAETPQAIRIDWSSLKTDLEAVRQLVDLYRKHVEAEQSRLIEEDDEQVLLLI